MSQQVSVEDLRGIDIIAPNDAYDLARLILRIQDAGDRLRSRGRRITTRSNVAHLAHVLAQIAAVPAEHVIALIEANAIPPSAMVVTPEEMPRHTSEGQGA